MFALRPSTRPSVSAWSIGVLLAVETSCTLFCAGCGDPPTCLETGNWTLCRQYDKIRDVFLGYSFSSDGHYFVSAGLDGKIRLYRTATGEIEASWDTLQKTVSRAEFSPDQTRLLTLGSQPSLALWDAKTHKSIGDSSANDASVSTISWSPDSTSLVTVDGASAVIRVWDAGSLKTKAKLEGHTDFVVDAQFSPNGTYIASISYDGTVRVWDAKSLKPMALLRKHSDRILCMAFSPNGDHLVTGGLRTSRKGTVIVWNMRQLSCVRDLKHDFDVAGVEFSPDGRFLITTDRYNLYVWDSVDWGYLNKRPRKEYALDMAVYSRDGRNAITMNLWDDPYTKPFLWKKVGETAEKSRAKDK